MLLASTTEHLLPFRCAETGTALLSFVCTTKPAGRALPSAGTQLLDQVCRRYAGAAPKLTVLPLSFTRLSVAYGSWMVIEPALKLCRLALVTCAAPGPQ